jgi:hypothetical protein
VSSGVAGGLPGRIGQLCLGRTVYDHNAFLGYEMKLSIYFPVIADDCSFGYDGAFIENGPADFRPGPNGAIVKDD